MGFILRLDNLKHSPKYFQMSLICPDSTVCWIPFSEAILEHSLYEATVECMFYKTIARASVRRAYAVYYVQKSAAYA